MKIYICEYCNSKFFPDLHEELDRIFLDEEEKYCSIECEEKATFLAAKRYRISMQTKNKIISLNEYKSNKKVLFLEKFLQPSLLNTESKGHHNSQKVNKLTEII